MDQAPDLTAVPWRAGRANGRTLYARTGGGDWKADATLGMLDTRELAAEAVRAHNAALTADDLAWLIGAGHDVRIGAHEHDCAAAVYVRLLNDEGLPDLFSAGGFAGVGQALASAREWSEGEGITP